MLIALDPMMDVSSCTLYERGEGAVQIKQVPQGIRSAEGGGWRAHTWTGRTRILMSPRE